MIDELRLTNYDLRITIYELRFTIYDLRFAPWPPKGGKRFGIIDN